MRRTILFILIVFSISLYPAHSQSAVKDTPQVLGKLFNRLLSIYEDSDRIRINDSIKVIVDSYVRSDTVLIHKFKRIRNLGQITSPDSLLKIVTWNLVLGSGNSRYYCYFIRKQVGGKPNIINLLTTQYRQDSIRTDTTYNSENWYGALYYDLRPYLTDNKKVWVLLGIDYGNPFITRKLIDVLSFPDEESVLLGKKWFVSGEKKKYRDVIGICIQCYDIVEILIRQLNCI